MKIWYKNMIQITIFLNPLERILIYSLLIQDLISITKNIIMIIIVLLDVVIILLKVEY
eukprot:jgi/Orpsp1_1/1178533/evm.model.c7180000065696.1